MLKRFRIQSRSTTALAASSLPCTSRRLGRSMPCILISIATRVTSSKARIASPVSLDLPVCMIGHTHVRPTTTPTHTRSPPANGALLPAHTIVNFRCDAKRGVCKTPAVFRVECVGRGLQTGSTVCGTRKSLASFLRPAHQSILSARS